MWYINALQDKSRNGSHMPLDNNVHWTWNNPLNIVLFIPLFLTAMAIILMIV